METSRRTQWIVLGGLAVLVVGALAWAALFGADDPTTAELELDAEVACHMAIEDNVDPVDVDFRDLGSAQVDRDGDVFAVSDRAEVAGALVDYGCEVRRLEDGDFSVDDIDLD